MINNINDNNSKNNFESIFHKKIYLKYHPKNEIIKKQEIDFIKSLIQGYIKKNINTRIKLNRTWLCVKVTFNAEEEINQDNTKETSNTQESKDTLLNLFYLPKDISKEIESYLKQYDKYIEIVNDDKDEFLIDLTSFIINNQKDKLDDENNLNLFLHSLKIEMEQKFNINVFFGKSNNILLASFACLKCFVESAKNKNNESIVINDINDLFEDNDKNDYLISVENDEKSILSFMNKFPLEYLSMSYNKYFENFLSKKINEKNFPDIKNLGDIINIYFEEIYNIYNKDNIFKDIFLFCLGVGEIFHKNQIITNNDQNTNDIKEISFKNQNKSQLYKIYIQLADKLFRQIFYYQHIPKTLVIILKNNKNKIYKRVVDKDSLFDNYDSLVNIGKKIINQICMGMSEHEINNFMKMIVYFDNIVKFDTINRDIWENMYQNEMEFVKIKTSKLHYWNKFLNSKTKEDNKNMSKSFDNNSKLSGSNKKNILNSKSIKDINKFSKKANMDLLGLCKKRKKTSKILKYSLLAKNDKLENYGVSSKENPK